MKILVTGGAGYIGSHVAKQLLEETEHDIVIVDNLSTGHQTTIDSLNAIRSLEFIHADLADFEKVQRIMYHGSFDAVLHFAASIVVPESVEKPLKYYMNNTVNTTHLINSCLDYGVKKFVFSSTAAVYGDAAVYSVSETTPVNPINPYGMSKLMSERVLQDAAKAHKQFNCVILRYFNVAGADIQNRIGQSCLSATHLIKIAVQTVVGKREYMSIFGEDYNTPDGTCIRDYIHVDDLASAHLCALEYLEENNSSNIFNCGYGYGFSVKEVISTIKKVSGVDFHVEIKDRRAGDSKQLISDNSKILNTLNWIPRYDNLELICKTALEWEKKGLC